MHLINTTLVIILLMAGLVVGLSLAETDLLNPQTSSAKAARIVSETSHQEQLDKLEEQRKQVEVEAYARQQKILAEEQIQRAALDLAYQQNMNTFKIQTAETWAETGNFTLMLTGALVALGLSSLPFAYAIRLPRSAPVKPAPPAEPLVDVPEQSNLWDDQEYRAFAIFLARQMELRRPGKKVERTLKLKYVQMSSAPVRHDDPGGQYKDLPLAGD